MIIDKVMEMASDEERELVRRNIQTAAELSIKAQKEQTDEAFKAADSFILDKFDDLKETLAMRYVCSHNEPAAFLDDLKEIIRAVRKKDFIAYADEQKQLNESWKIAENPDTQITLKVIERLNIRAQQTYENSIYFLYRCCALQYRILEAAPDATLKEEAQRYIIKKANQWYKNSKPAADIISVGGHRAKKYGIMLAKLSLDPFERTKTKEPQTDIPGQLRWSFDLKLEKDGDEERTANYTVIINGLEYSPKTVLSDYDMRLYNAISTLYDAGNAVVSPSQIYRMMTGSAKKPDASTIEKIMTHAIKIGGTFIKADLSEDYKPYLEGTSVTRLKRGNYLLHFETREAEINGAYTEYGIKITEPPILYEYAKERKQITSVDINLLNTGKKLSDDQIALENYLLKRISEMKNPSRKSSDRILYNSIFERLEIKSDDRKKKARIIANMYEVLEHYKKCGWITGYKESTNSKREPSVTISYKKTSELLPQN